MSPCHFANKISYIFVEVLIVVFAFKNTFNGSIHFSKRTASLIFISVLARKSLHFECVLSVVEVFSGRLNEQQKV